MTQGRTFAFVENLIALLRYACSKFSLGALASRFWLHSRHAWVRLFEALKPARCKQHGGKSLNTSEYQAGHMQCHIRVQLG